MKQLAILFIAIVSSWSSFAQSVTLEIKNIRNLKGQLQVSVFENQDQFSDEKPAKTISFDKKDINNGTKHVTLELEPGIYGISVLDDEDNSNDMTYRLGVYPREGVGFTGYKLSGMSKPKFADFDFTVPQGSKSLLVDMKYF